MTAEELDGMAKWIVATEPRSRVKALLQMPDEDKQELIAKLKADGYEPPEGWH